VKVVSAGAGVAADPAAAADGSCTPAVPAHSMWLMLCSSPAGNMLAVHVIKNVACTAMQQVCEWACFQADRAASQGHGSGTHQAGAMPLLRHHALLRTPQCVVQFGGSGTGRLRRIWELPGTPAATPAAPAPAAAVSPWGHLSHPGRLAAPHVTVCGQDQTQIPAVPSLPLQDAGLDQTAGSSLELLQYWFRARYVANDGCAGCSNAQNASAILLSSAGATYHMPTWTNTSRSMQH
jgi:hypothetical protein